MNAWATLLRAGRAWFARPGAAAGVPDPSSSGVRVSGGELLSLRFSARHLSLRGVRLTGSTLAGAQHSRLRGRGIDYQESRAYQPGDDIRTMDWRVTARSPHPHTKVYREERERPVIVLVDFGPGMWFATRGAFKAVIAARAAALLGWAAVREGDRIGALLSAGVHHELRPTGGRRGALRLIQRLVAAAPDTAPERAAGGAFGVALERLRHVTRPGSLVFLLSDFFALDDDGERHLAKLRQHNDVVACRITDPLEQAPPPPGRYGFTDGWRDGILDTRARRTRAAYAEYCARHRQALVDLLGRYRIPLLHLRTTDEVAASLQIQLGGARPPPARAS